MRNGMRIGTLVTLARDVERFPHFIAPKGSTGVVDANDENFITVRMDKTIEGAEDWNNRILWTDDDVAEFEMDVALRMDAPSRFEFSGRTPDGYVYTAPHEMCNVVAVTFPQGYFDNMTRPDFVLVSINVGV